MSGVSRRRKAAGRRQVHILFATAKDHEPFNLAYRSPERLIDHCIGWLRRQGHPAQVDPVTYLGWLERDGQVTIAGGPWSLHIARLDIQDAP